MMLAYWDEEWITCGRGPAHGSGCGIGVRPSMAEWAQERGMERRVPGSWSKFLSSTNHIRFFPQLRYNGFQVWPAAWHPTEFEPILQVDIAPNAPEVYARYGLSNPDDFDRLMAALRRDGWDVWDPRETARKYVHVDDLEKIEGPPPDGPF